MNGIVKTQVPVGIVREFSDEKKIETTSLHLSVTSRALLERLEGFLAKKAETIFVLVKVIVTYARTFLWMV